MGRYIIKIKDYYLEWSTVVDAPVTFGMNLDEFRKYYLEEYGTHGSRDLDDRLERVEKYGSSSNRQESAEDIVSGNRAGKDEKCLTFGQIYIAYCLRKRLKDGFAVSSVEI